MSWQRCWSGAAFLPACISGWQCRVQQPLLILFRCQLGRWAQRRRGNHECIGNITAASRWLRLPIRRTQPGKLLLHEFKRVLELMSPAVTTKGLTSASAPRWYLITGMHDCVSRELLRHSGFDRILPATLRRNNTVISEDAHSHDWYVSQDTCLLGLSHGERDTTLPRMLLRLLPALQRKVALSGLIITVSADTLCDAAPENLQQLRNVVQHCSRIWPACAHRRCPFTCWSAAVK